MAFEVRSVQFAANPDAGQRRIHNGRQAFPAEVVNYIQYPEPAATGQTVGHKVEAPPLTKQRHGTPASQPIDLVRPYSTNRGSLCLNLLGFRGFRKPPTESLSRVANVVQRAVVPHIL
jgi:hypothetical protein